MMRAELQKLHAKRRTVEAKQQALLAEEAEQKASERMRELKALMGARAEPPAEPAEDGEPEADGDGAAAAAAAAEEPTGGEPPVPPPAEESRGSAWC